MEAEGFVINYKIGIKLADDKDNIISLKQIYRKGMCWMFTLVLKNGTIIDGTKKKAYKADIGIIDSRIVKIGEIDQKENVIDIEGRYVTPGFIDTHSHADCSAFLYPDCESYIRQGITTFIGGQCGDSNAPINNYWMRKYWEYDMWNDIDPFIYSPQTVQPVDKVLPVVKDKTGQAVEWKSFGEYIKLVEKKGMACNMITLAGHSQIRADVMGLDYMRKPTREEMAKMKEHLTEAMESGAWGMSTGRDYPPSASADKEEIIELVNHIKELGGYYFTHWRRTGLRIAGSARPNKLEGIVEALEIALETGVKTEISHLTSGFEIYPENPEMDRHASEITLEVIDSYIEKGADVAFDVIPGVSGGICINPYLASYFTPWIKQSGSLDQFITNLKAKDYKNKLVKLLRDGEWYPLSGKSDPWWQNKIFITKSESECYIGKSINDIAIEKNMEPVEAVMQLLLEEPFIMIRRNGKSEEEFKTLLKHDRASVCTDTYAFDLVGLYGNDAEIAELLPHPHTYCAFPKYILQYGMDTIEETIWKITGFPADFMNIEGRGKVLENNYADLVVLDMDSLKTNENYIEPRVYPEGIEYVVVNGQLVLDKKGCTGIRAGKVLKKQ